MGNIGSGAAPSLTVSEFDFLADEDDELAYEYARLVVQRADSPDASLVWKTEHFPEQQRFVLDDSSRVLALCSRRAGKSEGLARKFLTVAESMPNELSVYIAVSKPLARMILWAALQSLEKRYSIGLTFAERDGQLNVVHPNGHRIWLAGCATRAEVDKFRGPRYALAVIDEAQNYPDWLRVLIEDVLDPACMDLKAQIVIAGTPGPIPAGYFFEASTGLEPGWSVHHWTVQQNPFIPHASEWLVQKLVKNGWTEQHPTYRREWLGEWVLDTGALVYPYDPALNGIESMPTDRPLIYGLGEDFGLDSPSAFVVAAYSPGHPEIYIVEAWKRSGMIPSRIAAETLRLREKYRLAHMVGDGGGLGAGYIEEFSQLHSLPIESAEKVNKRGYQELMRGELWSGQLKVYVPGCRDLLDEWQRLQWADETQAEEHPGAANHCADAALYITRKLRPYYRPVEEVAKPGTAEFEAKKMQDYKKSLAAKIRKGKRR